ncbi:uncharacterized protein LOC128327969 isoform X2 [Hemicordylus capensis]|uniref:uncharacterized protein LOC128327969 isoform X2 n=1 Tax=Hemicordylus capensis TaxID=884348 RepID=UPI002303254C|nr:uncharacterized protein LOC128327969 isoform X2 [Hemicordylus capensis]
MGPATSHWPSQQGQGISASAVPQLGELLTVQPVQLERRMKTRELGAIRGTQKRHPPSPPELQGRGKAKRETAQPTGEIQLPPKCPPMQNKFLVPKQQFLPECLFPPRPPEQTKDISSGKVLSKGTASRLVAPGDKDTKCAKPRVLLFDFLPPITSVPKQLKTTKKAKAGSDGEEVGGKLPVERNGKRARAAGADNVPAPKLPRGSPKAEGKERSGEMATAALVQQKGRTSQKIPTCHLELAVQPHQPRTPAGTMPGHKLLEMPQVLPGRGKAQLQLPEAEAGDTKRQKVGAESSGTAQEEGPAVPPTPRSSLARMMRDSVQVFHALGSPEKSKCAERHPGQNVAGKNPSMSLGRPPWGNGIVQKQQNPVPHGLATHGGGWQPPSGPPQHPPSAVMGLLKPPFFPMEKNLKATCGVLGWPRVSGGLVQRGCQPPPWVANPWGTGFCCFGSVLSVDSLVAYKIFNDKP